MEVKITNLEERTDFDRSTGFYRYKLALFKVNGSEHTLKISMPDFNAGRTNDLVQAEADKILAVLQKKK